MELIDFCYDILILILEEVDPADLAAVSQTSRAFHTFIKGNQRLFKAHYLQKLDDPRQNPSDPDPDWVAEVQRLVKCEKILASGNEELIRTHFAYVASTTERMINTASERNGVSRNRAHLERLYEKPEALLWMMNRSSLYGRASPKEALAAENEEDRQLSAKLHCYRGVPWDELRRGYLPTGYAKSRVYDLRNYTAETRWGPFRDDGSLRVDWEMVEAVMIDLAYNSDRCCPRFLPHFKPTWAEPFEGVIQPAGIWYEKGRLKASLPVEPEIPLDLRDPYGVSGCYHRIVCFLDYNDLYRYNFGRFQPRPDEPRPLLEEQEAIRHIVMKLQVTRIEPASKANDLPTVHFSGLSKSVDAIWEMDTQSKIRGQVRLTPEGEVHWTSISVFYGEERWRSEGIQVGGIRSKRGVTGTWFDKDYDDHGPVGPTAFWKVGDECWDVSKRDESDDDDDNSDAEDEDFYPMVD